MFPVATQLSEPMSEDPEATALTRLLLESSAQHLRLTLEPLPVGTILVSRNGVVKSVDDWTRKRLGIESNLLLRYSITTLFKGQAFDFLDALREKRFGCIGEVELKANGEHCVNAVLVLTPGDERHKYVFNLIWTDEFDFNAQAPATLPI